MWPDPDRLELQLFQPPAGLVTAAVPSPLPIERDGRSCPAASITCSSVSAVSRNRCRTTGWCTAPRPNGRPIQRARLVSPGAQYPPGPGGGAAGQAPTIAHYGIKVAPFDRSALETRLRELGARMLPAADEPDVVRFADNNGIIVEVRVAE